MTPTDQERHAISCVGKRQYISKAAAIVARDKMLARPNRRKTVKETGRAVRLGPYRCSACGYFHLGHSA